MMLYKIVLMSGDHGVSVFPPEDQVLPQVEELAGEPMSDIIRRIVTKGYTEHEAYLAVQAWAYHAKVDLNQAARGIRVFCEMCAAEIPVKTPIAPPAIWGVIVLVAVIAAAALGLYLWVTLDVEKGQRFGGHPWAYVMRYEERLWQGEVLWVSAGQEGVYEQGADLGAVLVENRRNFMYIDRRLDMFMLYGRLVLEGRRLLFYHIYKWMWWAVFFCGVLTNLGGRRYRLREGGNDPYKPTGLWLRPGGDWGTPEYEGCWQEWWWL